MVRICFVIFVSLLGLSLQKSLRQDDSYVAAVVEYQVQTDVNINIENYVRLIQDAAKQDADIVVFPEMTLTRGLRAVPVPMYTTIKEYPIPALRSDLYDEILVSISAAARQYKIYVVINIQEAMNCHNDTQEFCPEKKIYWFNTNVVFDRTGAVIDRYRKINLFGEFTRTPALRPDLGIFTTDFGVTFGHYICFDLMFQVPAIQVVEKHNITDVIFTTMWFSEMPYLTATQIQEAYAYAMNVNFLASGANNVGVGSAGSGIFSGKAGALISVMPGEPTTRLLVARVPKVPGQVSGSYPGHIHDDPKVQDDLRLISDPSLPSHVSRVLVDGFQEFTLVDNDVTCQFTVRMSRRQSDKHYVYRAAAFSGIRSFSGMATGGNRVCAVFVCSGDDISTCSVRFPEYEENTTAVFEELTIVATVPTPEIVPELNARDSAYFPVSLDIHISPLPPTDYEYTEETGQNNTVYTFKLTNSDVELYSFAVWGRLYAPDGEDATPPRD